MKKEVSNTKAAERQRKWRLENPEKAREQSREASRKRRERFPEVVRQSNVEVKRKWRETHPDEAREYQRQWREKNPDKNEAIRKAWRTNNPEYDQEWRDRNREKVRKAALASYYKNREANCLKSHWRNVKRKYGLTSEQYDELLASQGGGCAICGSKQNGKRLPVDHCHKTGEVRGILCQRCNTLMGHLEILGDAWESKMKAYLKVSSVVN